MYNDDPLTANRGHTRRHIICKLLTCLLTSTPRRSPTSHDRTSPDLQELKKKKKEEEGYSLYLLTYLLVDSSVQEEEEEEFGAQ